MVGDRSADGVVRIGGMVEKPAQHEAPSDLINILVSRDGNEFAEPRQWGAHYRTVPKALEKRRSPSTMSCISVMP